MAREEDGSEEIRLETLALALDQTGDVMVHTRSTVALELANGVTCNFTIRRDGGVAWVTMTASGEGDAKKTADALMARAKGWEFRIPKSKADAILKDRAELLETVQS
jgi:hypothetical protein